MYMAEQAIHKQVIPKMNALLQSDFSTLEEIRNYVLRTPSLLEEVKNLLDSISIFDPAVGSGHYLVSCLNELMKLKAMFGLVHKEIIIDVINDELIITDTFGNPFAYQIKNEQIPEKSQDIQKAIFDAKKHIIERQIFGTDINPNSVNICRLRLWIELLKHSYFTDHNYQDLEVLPNLEFKVMSADSLIPLQRDLDQMSLVDTDYETLEQELQKFFHSYYQATGNKDSIKNEILAILDNMKNLTKFSSKGNDQIEQLQKFSPFNITAVSPFFDGSLMFGVQKFDIVIMNPPVLWLKQKPPLPKPYENRGHLPAIFRASL